MAHDELTPAADNLAERAADEALEAARVFLEGNGNELVDMVVLLRIRHGRPDAATAAHSTEDEPDAAWLAAKLFMHARAVLNTVGQDIHIVPLDQPVGHG